MSSQVRVVCRELMQITMKYALCQMCTGRGFDAVRDHIWSQMERLVSDARLEHPGSCPYAFSSPTPPVDTSVLSNLPSDNETSKMVTSVYCWLDSLVLEAIESGKDMEPVLRNIERLREQLWMETWNMVTSEPSLAWVLNV